MLKVVVVNVGDPVQLSKPDPMTPSLLVDRRYLLSGVDRVKFQFRYLRLLTLRDHLLSGVVRVQLQFRHFREARDPAGGGSRTALV